MALPVTPELVQRAAHDLAEGGWRYTRRQLYYATCAAAETPRSPRGVGAVEIAMGILLVLVALIVIAIKPVFITLLAVGAILVGVGLVQRLSYRPPRGRLLAISFLEFEQRFSALELPGLVVTEAQPSPGKLTDTASLLVVCESPESAAMVAAALVPAGLGDLAVIAAASLPNPPGERQVVAVHDASPRGCALSLELRDAGLDVLDLGLRPEWVDSPAFQVIEGAPARLPRDLSALLGVEEVDWLASGRRVELASLPPRRLAALLGLARDGGQQGASGVRALQLDDSSRASVLGISERGPGGSAGRAAAERLGSAPTRH